MKKGLKYENVRWIFQIFVLGKCQNNLQQHWILGFIDVSVWLSKIPRFPIGGFRFWDSLRCWNPAAVETRDLNRISQRGGSGEQAQSQSSVPGFCGLTANGRFEKKDKALFKKKPLRPCSCSSKSKVISNIQRIATKLVQIYVSSVTYLTTTCYFSPFTALWGMYPDKVCKSNLTALYTLILNRKFKVKQSTSRTITRTPIHTLFLHPGIYNGRVPLKGKTGRT